MPRRPAERRRNALSLVASSLVILVGLGYAPSAASAADTRERQWYLDAMQADHMWEESTGKGVLVAVVDNGVDASIPELQGQIKGSEDLSGASAETAVKSSSHGTQMAALIAGTGKNGLVRGLAPGSRILSLRITQAEGLKSFGDPTYAWVDAIRSAVAKGARVINISEVVRAADLNEASRKRLRAAVDEANAKGLLIFAGTGNSGKGTNDVGYPAALPGVVGVAATDKHGTVADFSTYGPQVALAAPGVDVPQRCMKSQGWCSGEGTSQATAFTSASAALIWSKHPTWTNNQVLRVMMETAGKPEGKVPSKYIGYGVIRPRQVLLEGKGSPGAADTNPLFPDYHPSGNASSPTATPSRGTEKLDDSKSSNRAPAASAGDDSDGPGPMLWAGVAGAIVLVVGGAIFLVRRRTAQAGG